MAEKNLRSMDKTQLLNIMRQQEIEIENLTSSKNEQIGQIESLNEEIKRLILERAEQLEKFIAEKVELTDKLTAEKNEQLKILADEKNEQIRILTIEKNDRNEQIKKQTGVKNENVDLLTAEKDEQIKNLIAENKKLVLEKEKLGAEKDKLDKLAKQLEKRQLGQPEQVKENQLPLENAGSLADAALSVSGLLQAAQATADVYLKNIKILEREKTASAEKIEYDARENSAAIIKNAEQKREKIVENEKKAIDEMRNVAGLYMDLIGKTNAELNNLTQRYKYMKIAQIDESQINDGLTNG